MAKGTAATLQKALEGKGNPPPAKNPEPPQSTERPGSYKAPSREGKTPITAYLSHDFKSSLRLIQAKRGGSVQELIAEALNDLFAKHNVPTVSE
jgi:hypothetical protein